jgi:pilus assembly protein CpaE
MKIAVIASTSTILNTLQEALASNSGQDQFVFLTRRSGKINLEEIDLVSTSIVIVDADKIEPLDLAVITSCTRNSMNPAFVFLTTAPTETMLLDLMRAGVNEVVKLPLNIAELSAAIERIRARHYISSATPPRGRIISFVSCKGGAGATFLATNLGYVLATNFNKKVLYIDLHMQYGDASFYLSETAGKNSFADIIGQAGLDSTVVASSSMQVAKNYYLLQAPEAIEKTSGIKPQQVDNLLSVAVQDYDFVLVDIAETFDGLTMKALDRSEQIYAVMQPILPYVRAMSKVLHVFTLLGYSAQKVKVVLNRMGKDTKPSQAKLEEVIQKTCEWVVPNDFNNSIESANSGVPIQKLAPDSPVSKSLMYLAANLVGDKVSARPSFFARLFG